MSTIGECNGNKVKHRLQPPWAAPPTSDKLSSMIRGTRPSDLVKALDDDEMVPSLGTEHAIFSVVLACDRRDVADAFFMKAVAECRGPLVAPPASWSTGLAPHGARSLAGGHLGIYRPRVYRAGLRGAPGVRAGGVMGVCAPHGSFGPH